MEPHLSNSRQRHEIPQNDGGRGTDRHYVQLKLMRDRAWVEWNKKPERYIRIVTGLCADGTTPKVMVKENEHYVILKDCNKQLEKLLTDFKLTPKARLG